MTNGVLYDQISEVNSELDTGSLSTVNSSALFMHLTMHNTLAADLRVVIYELVAEEETLCVADFFIPSGTDFALGGWGPGCLLSIGGIPAFAAPVPPAIRIHVYSPGESNTARLRIVSAE